MQDLFADERCSQAIQDFHTTTQVGKRVLGPAEEDALSVASEWKLRGAKRGTETRRRDEDLETEVEEHLEFHPGPQRSSLSTIAEEREERGRKKVEDDSFDFL